MKRSRAFWLMMIVCSASVNIFTFVSSAAVSSDKNAAVSSQNTSNTTTSQTKGDMPPMMNSGPAPMMNSGPAPVMNSGPAPVTNSGTTPGMNTGTAPPPTTGSYEMQNEYESTTATMGVTTTNPPTPTGAPTTSNYSGMESSKPPPYVDMYGNRLPQIINGTQYMPETTDEIEAIRPVVPLNGNGDASGGVALLVRIPTQYVSQQGLPAIQMNRLEDFGEHNPNNFRDTEPVTQVQAYPGYPSAFVSSAQAQPASMGSVPQVQQYSGYKAVVLPVEAYKVDWYSDSSNSDTSIKKPLDNFFYR